MSAHRALEEDFRRAVSGDLRLLARLHDHELSASDLQALARVGFPDNLGLRLEGDSGREALFFLCRVVASWAGLESEQPLVDALAADYAAIYLNHSYQASPFESVWLDEDHLAMQEPMFQVRAWYRRYGLAVPDWRRRADDHLAYQLEFMAHLAESRAEETWSALARFLDEHPLRWIGDFAERVTQRAQEPFYVGLARITAAYLDELRDVLVQLLGEPRPDPEEIERRMQQATRAGQRPDLAQPAAYVPGVGPTW